MYFKLSPFIVVLEEFYSKEIKIIEYSKCRGKLQTNAYKKLFIGMELRKIYFRIIKIKSIFIVYKNRALPDFKKMNSLSLNAEENYKQMLTKKLFNATELRKINFWIIKIKSIFSVNKKQALPDLKKDEIAFPLVKCI